VKRLFGALGVDYVQWRALVRANLLVDYAALTGAYGRAVAWRAARDLVFMFVAFGFMGGFVALVIWLSDDMLLATTVMITTIGSFIAGIALFKGSTIITPADYEIVGFRPVSSRTYLAVRVAAILWHVAELTIVMAYLPLVALFTRREGGLLVAAAAALAIILAVSTITFGLIVIHGWLLRLRPTWVERLQTHAAHLCVLISVAGLILSIGQFVDAMMPESPMLPELSLPRTGWTIWFPGVWFASYVELARGAAGSFEITASILSVLLMAAIVLSLQGKLAADYARRVALVATKAPAPLPAPPLWSRLRNEPRAVALLMRAQLRDDADLQGEVVMNVLMMVLMVALFGTVLDGSGDVRDPFIERTPGFEFYAYAAIYLPLSLLNGFITTANVDASWPFFTTPANRMALAAAPRDLIALLVLPPVLVVVAILASHSFGHVGHGLLHTLVIGVLAYDALLVSTIVDPAVPFSRPRVGTRFSARRFLGPVVAILPLVLFQAFLYRSRIGLALGLAGLTMATWALRRWTQTRGSRIVRHMRYAG
jgi:hypothetical protein